MHALVFGSINQHINWSA